MCVGYSCSNTVVFSSDGDGLPVVVVQPMEPSSVGLGDGEVVGADAGARVSGAVERRGGVSE